MNAHSALIVPIFIVWHFIDSPAIGGFLLIHAAITWMKLVSYAAANEDYRLTCQTKEGIHAFKSSLALVEGLDVADESIMYPMNVSVKNILYFWCDQSHVSRNDPPVMLCLMHLTDGLFLFSYICFRFAPTLTYQIAFPRSPNIRWLHVFSILVRMTLAMALFTFLIAQIVTPALASLVSDLQDTNGTYTYHILAEYGLKLSVANTYLWLLMFYVYFHLYLNLFAEVSHREQVLLV